VTPPRWRSRWTTRLCAGALTNLLANAARAGAHRVQAVVRDRGGETELRVEGDGPGFPPEALPHVFARFVRGQTSRTGEGTGLGLAIVEAVARAHSGRAEAANDSALGGARVSLVLPRR
jgi:two-component system OmpR family sensor kinase